VILDILKKSIVANDCKLSLIIIIIIKRDLREIGLDSMDRIDLAQDRDQWRALVNTVMNFRVP
jgi:hypothetical protein